MCKLPDGVANSDVGDLKERIGRHIDPALQYACRSWHTHLVGGHTMSDHRLEITSALRQFLEKNFLFWLEVLSVLGAVKNAVVALQAAAGCLEVRSDSMHNVLPGFPNFNQDPPTLDLANDCGRFVTGYSEIISASSPHIYHSALVSTPKTSIIRKLYETHAQPLMRVVHGVPVSWDPHSAATRRHPKTNLAAWSPCNKFIAIYNAMKVHILDPATLQDLQNLEFPQGASTRTQALVFSPDSRMLTCSGGTHRGALVVSWDLHTGGVVSAVTRQGPGGQHKSRIAYSANGKAVGVLHYFSFACFISIYDVASGVHMHDIYHGAQGDRHSVADPPLYDVWTHGGSLRFATAEKTTITVWEVGFTAGATPTKVETLSVPDLPVPDARPCHGNRPLTALIGDLPKVLANTRFLPALRRLGLVHSHPTRQVLVWDAQESKSLLHHADVDFSQGMSFSSDGRFFACSTEGSEIYLWKEFSTSYMLHGKFTSSDQDPIPLLSPDGKSIVVFNRSMIQLWHIAPSGTLTQAPQRREDFVLDFLPDGPLAVVARQRDKTVTVLDLKSGVPWLSIDTPMEVCGVRLIGNTVAVIGDGEVITWNLSGRNRARMTVEDSVQAINFVVREPGNVVAASISLDLRYVALLRRQNVMGLGLLVRHLYVYSASAGPYSTGGPAEWDAVWFPPDGQNIWCARRNGVELYKIRASHRTGLESTMSTAGFERLPSGCPWRSPHDYQVTNDGWVLSGSGKVLFMLPPSWQSEATRRVWNGQFLGLLHGVLPEPVILELEPQPVPS